jgi:hypothetical protein
MGILKSAWKVLLLIIIVVFVLLYIASNKVEDKYQKAISAMNKGDWSSAVALISEVPHYKEASELYVYMYPNKLFYSKQGSEESALEAYKSAATFIQENKGSLKGTPDEKYINALSELEKTLNFKIEALTAKIQDEPIKKNLTDGADLIKKFNNQEALNKLNAIDNNSIYGTDKQELIKYINLLNVIPSNDSKLIFGGIAALNPNYGGILCDEIRSTVQTYVDAVEWNQIYIGNKDKKPESTQTTDTLQNNQLPAAPPPVVISKSVTVGMKKEEVVQIMGNPAASSVISNKYGVFEKMSYSNNRYVYLENNIVSAVK